jgi:hypothetical protein
MPPVKFFGGTFFNCGYKKTVDFFIDFQIFSVNSRKSAQNMEKFTRVSKPQN